MDERLGWPPKTAAAAIGLLVAVWGAGFLLLALGRELGWLVAFLAGWMTVGLVYTAWRSPAEG
jgi:hypothetical protein